MIVQQFVLVGEQACVSQHFTRARSYRTAVVLELGVSIGFYLGLCVGELCLLRVHPS